MTLPKVRCPICGALESEVVEGRTDFEANRYWRRRECTACQEKFTTIEIVTPVDRPRNPRNI